MAAAGAAAALRSTAAAGPLPARAKPSARLGPEAAPPPAAPPPPEAAPVAASGGGAPPRTPLLRGPGSEVSAGLGSPPPAPPLVMVEVPDRVL